MKTLLSAALGAALLHGLASSGQEPGATTYLEFVRAQAAQLRAGDEPPRNASQWSAMKRKLRQDLEASWGSFPADPAPLQPRQLGGFARDGYRVEKIIFQTFPGVWMTANAYVPDLPAPLPALLMVHGHWRGAKQDPVVQARCIGAAKLGFFVLAVDAFGAGERGIQHALGEYHGEMTAAVLLPPGLPLAGLQVYENMRAVDYLRTRPEVDPERIGITGASGGGNQTMYASAWDERLAAAAPVCSVGNYQAYLGAACCMCEVVPGALRFTEEWAVLGLTAPRALMVINATRDARQFSVPEAAKSMRAVNPVFEALGKPAHARHVTFESGHDYSQPMREAVYGWMALHLKGQGDGSPLAEPALQTEDPESLRCFPGSSRPDDWVTIPRFAAGRARDAAAQARRKDPGERKASLARLLGGFPATAPEVQVSAAPGGRVLTFAPEPGITLRAVQERPEASRLAIILDLDGRERAAQSPAARQAAATGWSVATLDLRATGALAWPSDKIGRAPDHTTAQWGLWIGRPLLGQWICDLRGLLAAVEKADGTLPGRIAVIGHGPAGLVALAAAVLEERVTQAAALGTLASYITSVPYEGQRMGIIVPGILKEAGDIPDLAALAAPKPLLMARPAQGSGKTLTPAELAAHYEPARQSYTLRDAAPRLQIIEGEESGALSAFFAQGQ